MGKAHTCVLTKIGEVWTFGVNNKGQCGRDTGSMSQAGKGEKIKKTNTHHNIILHTVFFLIIFILCLIWRFSFLFLYCSVWCRKHGHSHGWRLGGWARREGREEHDVPARHAQMEVRPVYGLHCVWRLHWLRCQLCQQWTARQSTRRVRGHTSLKGGRCSL